MESKFKIGDKVRIKKSYEMYSYIGMPGTVIRLFHPHLFEVLLDQQGIPPMSLYDFELELADNALVKIKKRLKLKKRYRK